MYCVFCGQSETGSINTYVCSICCNKLLSIYESGKINLLYNKLVEKQRYDKAEALQRICGIENMEDIVNGEQRNRFKECADGKRFDRINGSNKRANLRPTKQ